MPAVSGQLVLSGVAQPQDLAVSNGIGRHLAHTLAAECGVADFALEPCVTVHAVHLHISCGGVSVQFGVAAIAAAANGTTTSDWREARARRLHTDASE